MGVNPDSVNAPATVWNEPTNIWNYDGAPLSVPIHAYTRVPTPKAAPDFELSQPRVLSDPAATPSDLSGARQASAVESPTTFRTVAGPFSAVRAHRILEQHRVQFWASDGVSTAVYPTNRPDPSKADVDVMYQNFLLFSYLPAGLTPSAQEFADLVTPSKVTAVLQGRLPSFGIDNSGALTPPVSKLSLDDLQTTALGTNTASYTPPIQPYTKSINTLCKAGENGAYAVPKGTPAAGSPNATGV